MVTAVIQCCVFNFSRTPSYHACAFGGILLVTLFMQPLQMFFSYLYHVFKYFFTACF